MGSFLSAARSAASILTKELRNNGRDQEEDAESEGGD